MQTDKAIMPIPNISASGPEATRRWCVSDRGAVDTTKMQSSSPVTLRFLAMHSCSHSLLPHLSIRVWPMGHHARSSLLELTKGSPSFWITAKCLPAWHWPKRWVQSLEKCSGVCKVTSEREQGQQMKRAWTGRGRSQLLCYAQQQP